MPPCGAFLIWLYENVFARGTAHPASFAVRGLLDFACDTTVKWRWTLCLNLVLYAGVQNRELEWGKRFVSNADANQWVTEHGDALYRYALLRVRDPSVAEELVQETFLAALKGLQSYQGKSSEHTWLIGILKHKVVDHIRQSSREMPTREIDDEVDSYFNDRGGWNLPPSLAGNPVSEIEQEQAGRQLADCMQVLPERLSKAFVLTQVDGLIADEACKLLGITTTNLWVMLHRARMRLRQCLESNGFGRKA